MRCIETALMWLIKPPASFAGSLVGKTLSCIAISSLIAVGTPWIEGRFSEGLDAAVQGTLLQQLNPPTSCTPTPQAPCVVVVAIDENEFREDFKQRSPLDPSELQKLIDALVLAKPLAVSIDLDMAPASADDGQPREALFVSLQALGEATDGRTVLVCPQSYSTVEPFALDASWVDRFGPKVSFANADLASDGLYYDQLMVPLGVAAANLSKFSPVQLQSARNEMATGHEICSNSRPGKKNAGQSTLIRPASLPVYNFKTAIENPQLLKDRVVVVGGIYGTSDRFYLRGIEQPAYGVMLHAWITHHELYPSKTLSDSAKLAIDVWIGLVVGGLFSLIWCAIGAKRKENPYAWRAFFYLLFMLLAVGVPLLLVFTAVMAAAEYGVLIGAAAMIVSVMFDGFLSSHEKLLDGNQGTDVKSEPCVPFASDGNQQILGKVYEILKSPFVSVPGGFVMGAIALAALFEKGDSLMVCGAVGVVCAWAMVWVGEKRWFVLPVAKDTSSFVLDDLVRGAWLGLRVGIVIYAVAIQPDNLLAATLVGAFVVSAFVFQKILVRYPFVTVETAGAQPPLLR